MTLNELFAVKTNCEVLASETHTIRADGIDLQVLAETCVVRDEGGDIVNASSYVRTSGGIYYSCINYAAAKQVAERMAGEWACGNLDWEPSHDDCCPNNGRWTC